MKTFFIGIALAVSISPLFSENTEPDKSKPRPSHQELPKVKGDPFRPNSPLTTS
jgi:hypothetical protein